MSKLHHSTGTGLIDARNIPERPRSLRLQTKYMERWADSIAQKEKALEKEREAFRKRNKGHTKEVDNFLYESAAQATKLATQAGSIKDELVNDFRSLWLELPRGDVARRTSLAVVHGLVERADSLSLVYAEEWLRQVYREAKTGQIKHAHELESSARALECGLPVLDPQRDPVRSRGLFGVVREIEYGQVRLSMWIHEGERDPSAPIWESCVIPTVDIPETYMELGVWVAWVERTYDFQGAMVEKGRFEPASSRRSVKGSRELLFETRWIRIERIWTG